jgi:hypothetical protein
LVQVLVGTGADCKGVTNLDFCSTANTGNLSTEPIWPYTGKGGITSYKPSAFIEGGIDLDAIPGVAACFPTFIAETRSSSGPSTGLSLDAQLKDLAFGQFELCQPSTSLSASADVTIINGGSTELSFSETNDGNEDLENVSLTVDNGCTAAYSSGDTSDVGILNEGETWVFTCTVSPTSTTTYTAYAVGTGVDSGILVTGNPTCTPSSSIFCSAAERDSVIVNVITPSTTLTKTAKVDITYTYVEDNTGDAPISAVSVSDDNCAPVTYSSGDTNNDQILDPDESWTFTCTASTTDGSDVSVTNVATGHGTAGGQAVPETGEHDSVTITVTHHAAY